MKKLISAFIFTLILVPTFAKAAQNPLSGSRLNVNAQRSARAYPDGTDCVNVDFEALNRDGMFLKNEPLIFTKPAAVKIADSSGEVKDTKDGFDSWCVSSTSSAQSQITVKLANYPTIRKSFKVNFQIDRSISDATERSLFIRKTPITFIAKIDPSVASGLKTAQLKYTYNRRYNSWGLWKKRIETVTKTMTCDTEGYCSATMTGDFSKRERNQTGNFSYTFKFVDKNGISYGRTFQGRLR